MRIYTRTGDAGETGLYGGHRVRKDDLRVETYGTVDEANALLGVAATHLHHDPELRNVVEDLQRGLFTLGGDLSAPRAAQEDKGPVPRIEPGHVSALEVLIDRYEEGLSPLRNFILPGGSPAAAALHQARAVARRAERVLVALKAAEGDAVNPQTLPYLNRLADLLFVLARAANHRAGVPDVPWSR